MHIVMYHTPATFCLTFQAGSREADPSRQRVELWTELAANRKIAAASEGMGDRPR